MSSPTPAPIDGELSLSDKSLTSIPEEIVKLYGTSITKLDLTGNQLTSCSSLTGFTSLHTLILDKNQLQSLSDIPSSLKTVTTLWLNNNRISDLNAIVNEIKTKFPSLQYLSMLKNPACPDVYFSDDQVDAYQRYRCYIISHLSHLAYLDSTPVLPTERKEAELRGHLMKVAKPKNGIHEGEQTPDSPPRASRSAGASVVANSKPPRVATFLAKGKPRYDGTNSEGNRFICNEDL